MNKDNIAIFDIESVGALHHWSSICEIGGVLVDKDLNEIDRFNLRCRLPEGEIPSAAACVVNKSDVNLLTKSNLSLYQMQSELEKVIRKWTPAIFIGWSNTTFDDSMIQNSFFRGLRYPYQMTSSPNKKHDGLKIAQGAYTVDNSIYKTENTEKGNVSLSLPSLCRNNGIDSTGAHNALYDSILVQKILKLTKEKQPETWDLFLRTSSKSQCETIIKKEKIFTLQETYYGKFYKFLVAPLHPNACIDIFRWGVACDLKVKVENLIDLSVDDLRIQAKKLKLIRRIPFNKAPIILPESYGFQQEPYNLIDKNIINKRAEMIKGNEEFSNKILTILREAAEEKEKSKSQENVFAEQTINKFASFKDSAIFPKWHSSDWNEKLRMLDKFEDERLVYFGKKIIFQEAPDVLPKDMLKKMQIEIAERILSDKEEKWMTCKDFYFECDNQRERYSKDSKILKQLDELNDHVMLIEKKYQNI